MIDFAGNAVLSGHDATPNLLAVEFDGDALVTLYFRDGENARRETDVLRPFLWLKEPFLFSDVKVRPLAGGAPFAFLAECANWATFLALRKALQQERLPFFALNDAAQQYLTRTGRTLFKGMEFPDLRRMQIDIETWCDPEFEFSNAERENDHIMAIALSDTSGWEELLVVDSTDAPASEKAVLQRLNEIIAERDPDVIEGHNLFKFDLPYIAARAKRHKAQLKWGRDGSRARSRSSRMQVAERTIDYPRFEVHGRHLVDTFLLVQLYDVGSRELEGFGLKTVARHFGIEAGDGESERTLLQGKEIQNAYIEQPTVFAEYALQDVRETRALSALLSPSYFIQARMFPYNYQTVMVRGNATRINALFLREYFRQDHALPDFPEARSFAGGYTDVFFTGVVRNVWHCDVASLYPSVMLAFGCFPKNDALGVFEGLLRDLRQFRLEAKNALQKTPENESNERSRLQALQSAFKILINSFYGYLGFSQAHFGDFEAAAEVTRIGRELLKKMVDWLQERGSQVIEIDTDGIFFVPPAGVEMEELEKGMNAMLPEGIHVEFDARYEAMFSYKAKNYALLRNNGDLLITGAALKSRGLEAFQRKFMEDFIRHLLQDEAHLVPKLRVEYEQALRERVWPVEMFMKTEALQDSLVNYQKKIQAGTRNRSAIYELALASGRDYRPGDQISYYVTGDKKRVVVFESAKLASDWDADNRDENVLYYLGKLEELAKKFDGMQPPEEDLFSRT